MKERQCKCGNRQFYATQRCYTDVIVDENNEFVSNPLDADGNDNGVVISDSDTAYGTYQCVNTACQKTYDNLDELEEVETAEEFFKKEVDFKLLQEQRGVLLEAAMKVTERERDAINGAVNLLEAILDIGVDSRFCRIDGDGNVLEGERETALNDPKAMRT